MATTTDTHKLLLDGDWIETSDWVEVRSPYSGDVVGRVAKAGAEEARRAVGAAALALESPLPAQRSSTGLPASSASGRKRSHRRSAPRPASRSALRA
jgi:acyl-CoA reductase-like NAD-dependent aldehyde dehydrogenase